MSGSKRRIHISLNKIHIGKELHTLVLYSLFPFLMHTNTVPVFTVQPLYRPPLPMRLFICLQTASQTGR